MTTIKLKIANDGERCGECAHRTVGGDHIGAWVICTIFSKVVLLDRCQPCLDAEVEDG